MNLPRLFKRRRRDRTRAHGASRGNKERQGRSRGGERQSRVARAFAVFRPSGALDLRVYIPTAGAVGSGSFAPPALFGKLVKYVIPTADAVGSGSFAPSALFGRLMKYVIPTAHAVGSGSFAPSALFGRLMKYVIPMAHAVGSGSFAPPALFRQ